MSLSVSKRGIRRIESEYKYDPRVTWIEDRYWITWCNGYHGPTIGIGYTFDFKEFFQCENAFLPFNRNAGQWQGQLVSEPGP